MTKMIITPTLQREKPRPREYLFKSPEQARVRNCCYIYLPAFQRSSCPYMPTHFAPTGDCKGNWNYISQEGPRRPSIACRALSPQGLLGVVVPGLPDPGRAVPVSGGGAAAPWRTG